jgi:hypothetical protein
MKKQNLNRRGTLFQVCDGDRIFELLAGVDIRMTRRLMLHSGAQSVNAKCSVKGRRELPPLRYDTNKLALHLFVTYNFLSSFKDTGMLHGALSLAMNNAGKY